MYNPKYLNTFEWYNISTRNRQRGTYFWMSQVQCKRLLIILRILWIYLPSWMLSNCRSLRTMTEFYPPYVMLRERTMDKVHGGLRFDTMTFVFVTLIHMVVQNQCYGGTPVNNHQLNKTVTIQHTFILPKIPPKRFSRCFYPFEK